MSRWRRQLRKRARRQKARMWLNTRGTSFFRAIVSQSPLLERAFDQPLFPGMTLMRKSDL